MIFRHLFEIETSASRYLLGCEGTCHSRLFVTQVRINVSNNSARSNKLSTINLGRIREVVNLGNTLVSVFFAAPLGMVHYDHSNVFSLSAYAGKRRRVAEFSGLNTDDMATLEPKISRFDCKLTGSTI
jgi:hypothetical protein